MKENQPPAYLTRFINWLIAPHLREQIVGDLQERYAHRLKLHGKVNAWRRYWLEAFAYMRPAFITRQKSKYPSFVFYNPDMIRNYFKIAFRNLAKNKGYSVINVGGLALGMAVAMLIGLWIYDELTFDQYHKNYDRIAQVMQTQNLGGDIVTQTQNPIPLEKELSATYGSYFKYLASSTMEANHILTFSGKQFTKTGRFMEPEGPEMFGLKMQIGNVTGLQEPGSILLSEKTATINLLVNGI